MEREYNLEKRLITFACKTTDIVEMLPSTRVGNYYAGQLVRCANSPAFNYGEAQAAESAADFVHKLRVVLKELKESRIALTIISLKKLVDPPGILPLQLSEVEELIAIIAASIETAEKNMGKK